MRKLLFSDIINILFIFGVILSFIFIFFVFYIIFIVEFDYEYRLNYRLNEDFLIQKDGSLKSEKIGFLSSDFQNLESTNYCIYVDYFTKKNDYYIGHFDGTNRKYERCRRYFYIKEDNTDIKFNVSFDEIIEKFGVVKFEEADEFINKYGEK